jgi:primosomal protein N' (replication factor Y)
VAVPLPRVRLLDMGATAQHGRQGGTSRAGAALLQALQERWSAASKACCCSTAAATRRCCTARLRLEERLPALQRLARVPQARPHAALPPLRLHRAVPRACPDCGNLDIAPVGRGTEKLEEQLAALLPEARIGRIDADTTRTKGRWKQQLAAVHEGAVDVLVGTQMVAKGHDFRRMTWWRPSTPTAALFSSDFRAPERLFALLMQAAGRAGRDAEQAARSEMWIQTWHPQHPLYAALRRHDFAAFAAAQLEERRGAAWLCCRPGPRRMTSRAR